MRFPTDVIPAAVQTLANELRKAEHGAWVVGGCVRDVLLGREASDWDIATSATPDEVRRVFRRVVPTGIEHGTVTVLLGDEGFEVTTLRGEVGYSDGRRPDQVFFVREIEADLARRDFTVNALAVDPTSGELCDPFGGMDDLRARTLRAVGEPAQRFGEDGLRILRGARFVATLEFELEEKTKAAMRPALDVFARVSAERVREEWLKAMRARQPSRAFEVMREVGILDVVLPELLEQVGCAQNAYHAYPVWEHTLACLDAAPSDDPILRIAVLLHDIAKPKTRAFSDKTQDFTFYHHEVEGAKMADAWLREYKFSRQERECITALIRHHLICYEPSWSDAAVRRFIRRVGEALIPRLFALARADAIGKGEPEKGDPMDVLRSLDELGGRIEQQLAAGSAFGTKDLAINGKDVMNVLGIRPGRVIGTVLEALLEQVLDDPRLNERDTLLAMLPETYQCVGATDVH